MKLNIQNPFFEMKFKRKPKNWTIEEVHELWIKAKERSNKRRKILCDCIDEIKNSIEPDSIDYRGKPVYKIHKVTKNSIICYTFSHSNYHKDTMSWHTDNIKLQTREERLSFLVNNTKKIELGSKFYKADKNLSYLDGRVGNILNELIDEKLKKHFKDSDFHRNESILTISISDRKYFIKQDNSRYPYKKYELLNEVNEQTHIDLK